MNFKSVRFNEKSYRKYFIIEGNVSIKKITIEVGPNAKQARENYHVIDSKLSYKKIETRKLVVLGGELKYNQTVYTSNKLLPDNLKRFVEFRKSSKRANGFYIDSLASNQPGEEMCVLF